MIGRDSAPITNLMSERQWRIQRNPFSSVGKILSLRSLEMTWGSGVRRAVPAQLLSSHGGAIAYISNGPALAGAQTDYS